jgi:hypothetical protein
MRMRVSGVGAKERTDGMGAIKEKYLNNKSYREPIDPYDQTCDDWEYMQMTDETIQELNETTKEDA